MHDLLLLSSNTNLILYYHEIRRLRLGVFWLCCVSEYDIQCVRNLKNVYCLNIRLFGWLISSNILGLHWFLYLFVVYVFHCLAGSTRVLLLELEKP